LPYAETMTADEELRERSESDESPEDTPSDHRDHLSDIEDGSGCTEIWEQLSEQREDDADEE
jgi:hypothetical protein